jgi:hypothetical protein
MLDAESAMGQERPIYGIRAMSALPPEAEIALRRIDSFIQLQPP